LPLHLRVAVSEKEEEKKNTKTRKRSSAKPTAPACLANVSVPRAGRWRKGRGKGKKGGRKEGRGREKKGGKIKKTPSPLSHYQKKMENFRKRRKKNHLY